MGSKDTIQALRDEVERLKSEVARLEGLLAGIPPREWSLIRQERRVLTLLARNDLVSIDEVVADLYGTARLKPDNQVVRAVIWALHKKLKPFGVEIRTVHGRGYALVDRSFVLRAMHLT